MVRSKKFYTIFNRNDQGCCDANLYSTKKYISTQVSAWGQAIHSKNSRRVWSPNYRIRWAVLCIVGDVHRVFRHEPYSVRSGNFV